MVLWVGWVIKHTVQLQLRFINWLQTLFFGQHTPTTVVVGRASIYTLWHVCFCRIRLASLREKLIFVLYLCSNLNLKHPSESEITTYGAVFILLHITLWGKKGLYRKFHDYHILKQCCCCWQEYLIMAKALSFAFPIKKSWDHPRQIRLILHQNCCPYLDLFTFWQFH